MRVPDAITASQLDIPESARSTTSFDWADPRPIVSALSSHLSERLTVEKIFNTAEYYDEDLPRLRFMRAASVPALVGARLDLASTRGLRGRLEQLLRDRVPAVAWDVSAESVARWTGPLQKYFYLHLSLPAPPDQTTGQAMALELFGQAVRIGEVVLDSDAGRQWREERRNARLHVMHSDRSLDALYPPITDSLCMELRVATYANVQYAGVNIPLYM